MQDVTHRVFSWVKATKAEGDVGREASIFRKRYLTESKKKED